MSIYATNFTVDETTGDVKLIKHLNKIRVDRTWCSPGPGKWNKTGKKARMNKESNIAVKKIRMNKSWIVNTN